MTDPIPELVAAVDDETKPEPERPRPLTGPDRERPVRPRAWLVADDGPRPFMWLVTAPEGEKAP